MSNAILYWVLRIGFVKDGLVKEGYLEELSQGKWSRQDSPCRGSKVPRYQVLVAGKIVRDSSG